MISSCNGILMGMFYVWLLFYMFKCVMCLQTDGGHLMQCDSKRNGLCLVVILSVQVLSVACWSSHSPELMNTLVLSWCSFYLLSRMNLKTLASEGHQCASVMPTACILEIRWIVMFIVSKIYLNCFLLRLQTSISHQDGWKIHAKQTAKSLHFFLMSAPTNEAIAELVEQQRECRLVRFYIGFVWCCMLAPLE